MLRCHFFNKTRKTIIKRSEKRLNIGTQSDVVMVIERTVVEGTNKAPEFLPSINIVAAQAKDDNVDKLVEDAEHYKEMMLKMKDTLVKERGEGRELKMKHEEILLEKESL